LQEGHRITSGSVRKARRVGRAEPEGGDLSDTGPNRSLIGPGSVAQEATAHGCRTQPLPAIQVLEALPRMRSRLLVPRIRAGATGMRRLRQRRAGAVQAESLLLATPRRLNIRRVSPGRARRRRQRCRPCRPAAANDRPPRASARRAAPRTAPTPPAPDVVDRRQPHRLDRSLSLARRRPPRALRMPG